MARRRQRSTARTVWATLLDEGRYLASQRTIYRLLAAKHGDVRERRAQLGHPDYERPELLAERPNEAFSWDRSQPGIPENSTELPADSTQWPLR